MRLCRVVNQPGNCSKASKKERGQILDEYIQTTQYHRKYAILVLSRKRTRRAKSAQRPRARVYTAEDARALEKVSDLFDGINAKLLRAALDNELKHLYDSGFLAISWASYARLTEYLQLSEMSNQTPPGLCRSPILLADMQISQRFLFHFRCHVSSIIRRTIRLIKHYSMNVS